MQKRKRRLSRLIKKASQSLRPQAQRSPIIFFGDMCGEENTSRPANARAVRHGRTARALQSGRKSLCQKVILFDSLKRRLSQSRDRRLVFGMEVVWRARARSALGACGGAGAAGPLPVGDLGQVDAVRGDVLPVLDELVAHLLHGVGAAVAELGQALDDIDDKVEAVELIEHAHVKRRRDRALLDVAADEHVLVVAGVRQLVDELRVAVEGEDDGLILREDEVVVLVRETVRVVGMRLELHEVNHVHDAHAHLR